MMGIKKDLVGLSVGCMCVGGGLDGVVGGKVLLQLVETCLILSSEPSDEICFITR